MKKTYKDFKRILQNPYYANYTWNYVKEQAIKDGFKSWQINLYKWWHLRKFHFGILTRWGRKILKWLWYVFIFVGLFFIAEDLRGLIKSTTRRNNMQSIESLVYVCKGTPQICNDATKIWKKGL